MVEVEVEVEAGLEAEAEVEAGVEAEAEAEAEAGVGRLGSRSRRQRCSFYGAPSTEGYTATVWAHGLVGGTGRLGPMASRCAGRCAPP